MDVPRFFFGHHIGTIAMVEPRISAVPLSETSGAAELSSAVAGGASTRLRCQLRDHRPMRRAHVRSHPARFAPPARAGKYVVDPHRRPTAVEGVPGAPAGT